MVSGTVVMGPESLEWIFIMGMIVSFFDAFSIGANDVANAFATAVGSGTLSLRQACCIALCTEFLGAVALGSNTAKTIAGDIISIKLYSGRPDLLMFSMLCAMMGSTMWVIFATKMAMPVSTTHSIVGAVLGVGVSAFGFGVVDWGYDKLGKILASFAISPAIAGVFASIIFLITKYGILETPQAYERALWTCPIYGAATSALVMSFWIKKGTPSLNLDKKPIGFQVGLILGVTAAVTLFCIFVIVPYFRKRTEQMEREEQARVEEEAKRAAAAAAGEADGKGKDGEIGTSESMALEINGNQTGDDSAPEFKKDKAGFIKHWANKTVFSGVNKEVAHYKSAKGNMVDMTDAHARATKYDPRAENVFKFVQVFTCSMASFAHGANDVGNAIAPLATIYYIYNNGIVPTGAVPVPTWMLAFGGAGINLGLLLYGYHIMRSLGNNITYHSPSRGFSMELGAAVTVLTAAYNGIPVSSTHCIAGATAAVGLCNGDAKAINWRMVAVCIFGWLLTLPLAGTIAGLIVAFGANAPNFNAGFP